jgi:hypothetical protein
MKLCKDCKWCELSSLPNLSLCKAPETEITLISVVTGEKSIAFKWGDDGPQQEHRPLATSLRSSIGWCGKEGVLWQAKEIPA